MLEFVDIGPRFSNVILQTILVLLKRIPPKVCLQCRLLVLWIVGRLSKYSFSECEIAVMWILSDALQVLW